MFQWVYWNLLTTGLDLPLGPQTSEPLNGQLYFLLRTSSTHAIAAIIFGNPVVVNASNTAWAISSLVAPDSMALQWVDSVLEES